MGLSAECIFKKLLTAEEKAVLRRLRDISDSEINYSDAPVLTAETARQINDFEFSEDEQARIHELIARNSTDGLWEEEKLELEQFLNVERILVILKVRSIWIMSVVGMNERAVVAPHEEVLRWHEEQLKNRPNWHAEQEPPREAPANRETIRYQEVTEWNNVGLLTVEDLIAEAIQEGKIIQGINDPETLKDREAAGRHLREGSFYSSEELRSLIHRWATTKYPRLSE
jgi:hypothetical protein